MFSPLWHFLICSLRILVSLDYLGITGAVEAQGALFSAGTYQKFSPKCVCCLTEPSVLKADTVLSVLTFMNEFCNMVLFHFYNLVIVQQIQTLCQSPALSQIMWALRAVLLCSNAFCIFTAGEMRM